MKKWTKTLIVTVFSFVVLFTCIGYAAVSDIMDITGTAETYVPDGVFITKAEISGNIEANLSASSVNKLFSTTLDSSVSLSESNGNSELTFAVTFYNNSDTSYIYDTVSYLEEVYSNKNIIFSVSLNNLFIDARDFMTLDITFAYNQKTVASDNALDSALSFRFKELEETTTSVVEGNSADNIGALADSKTNYDGSNTQNRWTNWSSETSGRGQPATLNIVFTEEKTIDEILFYHFVDANQNANRYGSCDFPDEIKIEYYAYNEQSQAYEYIELTSYSTQKNYSNEKRRNGDGVYTMNITDENGKTASVAFTHNYSGTPPITTYTLNQSITTRALKITLTPKANFFVGLMELEVLNDGKNIMYEEVTQ